MTNDVLRGAVGAVIASGAMLLSGQAGAASYLIVANQALPSNLSTQVKQAGGKLEKTYPFGVAVASSDNPRFAASIKGVQFVIEDKGFTVARPAMEVFGPDFNANSGSPPNSGDDDFFFDLQ